MWGKLGIVLALLVSAAAAQSISYRELQPRRVMIVEAVVNGRTANLIVDTGADQTVVSPELAGLNQVDLVTARFSSNGPGLRAEAIVREADLKLTSDRGFRIPVMVMRLESVSKIYGVKVDGLIGQDLLSRYGRVSIDYNNKKIELGE
ncbi:MAG TPA: retropepsin-like aspartic protease [Terriglobales bacterium]|nr:retropepsin-like aspartic protease [Terriglobales bacterium]